MARINSFCRHVAQCLANEAYRGRCIGRKQAGEAYSALREEGNPPRGTKRYVKRKRRKRINRTRCRRFICFATLRPDPTCLAYISSGISYYPNAKSKEGKDDDDDVVREENVLSFERKIYVRVT